MRWDGCNFVHDGALWRTDEVYILQDEINEIGLTLVLNSIRILQVPVPNRYGAYTLSSHLNTYVLPPWPLEGATVILNW